MSALTWVEISKEALRNNIRQFRGIVGENVLLCPCIKANAYGHGLVLCAQTFLEGLELIGWRLILCMKRGFCGRPELRRRYIF